MAYLKGFKLHFVNLSVSAHFGSFRRLNLLVVVTQARCRGDNVEILALRVEKKKIAKSVQLKK